MFASFSKSMHLFPIFLAKCQDRRGALRLLHSTERFTVYCIILKRNCTHFHMYTGFEVSNRHTKIFSKYFWMICFFDLMIAWLKLYRHTQILKRSAHICGALSTGWGNNCFLSVFINGIEGRFSTTAFILHWVMVYHNSRFSETWSKRAKAPNCGHDWFHVEI